MGHIRYEPNVIKNLIIFSSSGFVYSI